MYTIVNLYLYFATKSFKFNTFSCKIENMYITKTIHDQLFGFAPTKSQKTMIAVAEAAIKNYVDAGVEETNFESIAQTCQLSRTIINRYFPAKSNLFMFTSKYIRACYQNFVIERIKDIQSPIVQLETYVRSSLLWVDKMPDHAHTWLLFFYYCGIRREYRKLNTELVEMGYSRLKQIVATCNGNAFRDDNLVRQLHLYLSGAIMAKLTEEKNFNSSLEENVWEFFKNHALVDRKIKR